MNTNSQVQALIQATEGALSGLTEPTSGSSEVNTSERVILRNASLSITVEDPESAISEIAAMAELMGGWVVESNTFSVSRGENDSSASGAITIRVPADRLNEAIEQIKQNTDAVSRETISGQDVTSEYVDLSSRLKNLQATETQLQSIMQSAATVEDVLAVQRELTTVRGEIETIQGRLNFFDEAAAYSSIRIEVLPIALSPVASQQLGWNPGSTIENALGTLVRVLQFLVDTLIVVAIIGLPLTLVVGIPGWFIWRSRKRHLKSQETNK